MGTSLRTRSIPREEWPKILTRRRNGETYAAIARDYGVTGPAIRYIVDKSETSAGNRTGQSGAAAPHPSTSDTGKPEAGPEAAASEDTNGVPRTELAGRLLKSAAGCAGLVDRLAEFGPEQNSEQDTKDAVHEVRRALAAIEIALIRGRLAGPNGHRADGGQSLAGTGSRDAVQEEAEPHEGPFHRGEVVEGTVKFFKPDRGFGFILPDRGGKDIYVPAKALQRSGIKALRPGERVWVSVAAGVKGPEAEKIGIPTS